MLWEKIKQSKEDWECEGEEEKTDCKFLKGWA